MNIQGLLKQAQQMQKDMSKVEGELKAKQYEKSIGGGVIKAIVSGEMQLIDLQIGDSLMNEDKQELQEMLMSVVNEAFQAALEDKESSMNELTAGIKIPGGF